MGIAAVPGKTMRRICGLFCLLAMVCGCAAPPSGTGMQPPATPGAEEAQQSAGKESELVFSVDADAPEAILEAARYFCDKLSAATQGAVVMTVSYSSAPDADLVSGRAAAALLSQKSQLEFSPPLAATASPFLYHSYRNFTMRSNSDATLRLLERSLRESDGLVPLAAFYQGTQQLLTDSPVSSYQQFENNVLAVGDDAQTRDAVARLGGDTRVAETAEQRMEMFLQGETTGAEIPLSFLEEFSGELPATSYLTLSNHQTIPAWLVVSADFFDGLTAGQRAGVYEICAYLTNLIDDRQVELENRLLSELNIPGLTVNTDFSNVRNRVFNTMQPVSPYAEVRQLVASDLVRMMRRIS